MSLQFILLLLITRVISLVTSTSLDVNISFWYGGFCFPYRMSSGPYPLSKYMHLFHWGSHAHDSQDHLGVSIHETILKQQRYIRRRRCSRGVNQICPNFRLSKLTSAYPVLSNPDICCRIVCSTDCKWNILFVTFFLKYIESLLTYVI